MIPSTSDKNSELERIKEDVRSSYIFFKDNFKRFNEFRKYCYKTTISEQQKAILQRDNKPFVEFNISEAQVSRLLGEFAKQEPSIEVTPSDGNPVPFQVIELVEGHIRHIIYESNKDNFSYEVYKDMLTGGFSAAKVFTDYKTPMSFEQQINLRRVFDPCLIGFDPMARAPHKGDGRYCFELFPMTLEDFKREFPDADTDSISYISDLEGFSWAYKDDKGTKIVLVCDYYEKKKKKVKIVQLANGRTMSVSDYKKLQKQWNDEGVMEQIPIVVGKPRWTILETVCRTRLIKNQILSYEETDYRYLPYVFFDGNSIVLSLDNTNVTYQMTRPYIYNAKGAQDLKNVAGQALAHYLETMVQHKFIVMKEAIPQEEDYLRALTNTQVANTIVVNAYSEDNPHEPIPNPIREVQTPPAPAEIMNTFAQTEATLQTILGSYASNLGKNDNDLSGKAVIESASVANAASMPYVVGYLQSLAHVGNVIVDLMPKYIKGKSLPIVSMQGEKLSIPVNQKHTPQIDFDEHAIHVNIEAGVNFQVQKNQALTQITALMGVSQEFNAFMNSPVGLPILIKNLTIHGADELEEAVPKWLEMQQQQQQQQMQMAAEMQKQNPQMIRAQAELIKNQHQAEQDEINTQLEIARLGIEEKRADAEILTAESKVTQAQIDSAVRLEETQTSQITHALDMAGKMAEIKDREHARELDKHNLHLDRMRLHHEINQANKPEKGTK